MTAHRPPLAAILVIPAVGHAKSVSTIATTTGTTRIAASGGRWAVMPSSWRSR